MSDLATTDATPCKAPTESAAEPSTVSWRFVTALGVLLTLALTLFTMSQWFESYFTKAPVPLKKSLREFNSARLRPEFDRHPISPKAVDHDTLQSLGTDEYAHLRIVDRRKPQMDRTYVADVFITYYTGKPDMVPHVPDECYQAGGYRPLGASYTDSESVRAAGLGLPENAVPVRVAQFDKHGGEPLTILYFFLVNNEYCTTRSEARLKLGSLRNKYAYYAKFEFHFTDNSLGKLASKEESLAALGPLLEKLMPIILEDHFQDWDQLTAKPQ